MKRLSLDMNEANWQRLEAERRERGLRNVATLILQKVGAATDGSANAICDQAMARGHSRRMPFRLRDLFDGSEWGAFSLDDRRLAGRIFYHRVLNGNHGIAVVPGPAGGAKHLYVGTPRRAKSPSQN